MYLPYTNTGVLYINYRPYLQILSFLFHDGSKIKTKNAVIDTPDFLFVFLVIDLESFLNTCNNFLTFNGIPIVKIRLGTNSS